MVGGGSADRLQALLGEGRRGASLGEETGGLTIVSTNDSFSWATNTIFHVLDRVGIEFEFSSLLY